LYIGRLDEELAFITVRVLDKKGIPVPTADNTIQFEIAGPGEVVATDNGDPADLTAFPSKERKAFNGMALGIIRATTSSGGDHSRYGNFQGIANGEAYPFFFTDEARMISSERSKMVLVEVILEMPFR
jgi:hypothetical protein